MGSLRSVKTVTDKYFDAVRLFYDEDDKQTRLIQSELTDRIGDGG
jgi:hypothetical protein